MYDIIGDIHGHAEELVQLLEKLDYQKSGEGYRHANRKVIFCGDFIDRGPEIPRTLQLVRAMCDSGDAFAVMGNHEFNALTFHTPHPDKAGSFLRSHHDRNVKQHRATLNQLSSAEMADTLAWFRTLPVAHDAGLVRVVHACWDDADLVTIRDAGADIGHMSLPFLVRASDREDPLFRAIERVLKGPEIHLPAGHFMVDKEGGKRPVTRIRWFEHPDQHSCASYSLPHLDDSALSQIPVPANARPALYLPELPPVFFGHYWLSGTNPQPLAPNVACVDFSVAKDGHLGAYRHHGESILISDHFVTQPTIR